MNPYEVLGLPDNADIETVKRTYKELVKKYHPDKYVNNPLADLASEKLKEINKAYDMIMSNSTGSSSGYSSQSSYSSDSSGFQEVRQLINSGNIALAEQKLNALPKNAEWNYLKGICCIKKGWYNDGLQFLRTACNLEPSNLEYRSTLNSFMSRNTTYRQYGTNVGGGMSACDCCANLCILDTCCECMGGDLISCF